MQNPTSADIQRVREFLLDLQARICAGLEQQEQAGGGTAQFVIDDWERPEGGGGRSRVLQNGEVIEKVGDVLSHQYLQTSSISYRTSSSNCRCQSTGSRYHWSFILKIRMSQPPMQMSVCLLLNQKAKIRFGGLVEDLTLLLYPDDEDVRAWHQKAYDLCQPFGEEVYTEHKQWCDDYFT